MVFQNISKRLQDVGVTFKCFTKNFENIDESFCFIEFASRLIITFLLAKLKLPPKPTASLLQSLLNRSFVFLSTGSFTDSLELEDMALIHNL